MDLKQKIIRANAPYLVFFIGNERRILTYGS